jgi:hypothetical protein
MTSCRWCSIYQSRSIIDWDHRERPKYRGDGEKDDDEERRRMRRKGNEKF